MILSAGILSSSGFFLVLEQEIIRRYNNAGKKVHVTGYYPYGMLANTVAESSYLLLSVYQSALIYTDMKLDSLNIRPSPNLASYGARQLSANAISEKNKYGGKLVLIGLSGGGVVAARAAGYMEEYDGVKVDSIIAVGTPKISLCKRPNYSYGGIENKTTFIKDIDDPITERLTK